MTSEYPAKPTVEGERKSTKPTPKHVFEGHKGGITCIVFLHDNVHFVSSSWDGTMRKWNCDTGLLVGEPWKREGGAVYALALSPDGNTIACGRANGSVQMWYTDGKMTEWVWKGHRGRVPSLSWSPSGRHLANASSDGTILIRNAESGEVDVGPIKTEQSYVHSLVYSPLGDRIASGSENRTICILDSKTGELVVGPIKDLRLPVTSLVWSSDGTKLYSASDKFARVFDSVSGAELHRFGHANYLYSVALSTKGNVLACVGFGGVAQLWDTETHEQLGQAFGNSHARLQFVLFSQDGRYLVHGGDDNDITLWLVNEIAPELVESAPATIEDAAAEKIQPDSPESPSSSYLDLDAKNPRARPGDDEGEGSGDRYKNFFRSSRTSLSLTPPDSRPHHHRFWTFVIPSRHRAPEKKSLPPKENQHKRTLFRRRARSKSPLQVPASTDYPKGKVQEGENVEETRNDVNCSPNSPPDVHKKKMDNGKGKRQEDTLADAQTPVPDDSPPLAEEREDQYEFQSSASSGPSRRRAPGNELIPLQQRPKRSFFTRHSGPRPVTIFAGRPRQFYWTAPRTVLPDPRDADRENANAQTGQSSSGAAHQPHSTTQKPQSQAATHPASAQREEYNFGCWGNFRLQLALCCVPRGTDIVAVPSAAS